jgi:hypothetical protein
MQIKNTIPIPELLRQLPEGTITYIDLRCLSALKECVKALRTEHEGQEAPNLFTQDVRMALALELNDALAQIIKARIPRQRANAKAKPNEEERTELQALKRAALEMREALEKFERVCIDTAGFEPIGAPPDASRRRAKLDPAFDAVQTPLDVLQCTPTRHPRLKEQIEAMSAHWDALEASVTRWCGLTSPSAGKAAGVHKGKALAAWLEACKKLGRDIAEELRNLK